MLLVSYEFGFFLAVILIVYYLVPGRFRWVLLLAGSYLFYLSGGPGYLLYPMTTTVSTWFLARRIGKLSENARLYKQTQNLGREQKKAYNRTVRRRMRRLLLAGLFLNFGILAALKYTNFLLQNLNGLFSFMNISWEFNMVGWILPLGISYYTFQSMGYLIDVYHEKYEPEPNLFRFALFVSFFPQLVSGPISRFDQIKDELFTVHPFDGRQLRLGAERMLWGYFKKLVIADRMGPAVSVIISSPAEYGGVYAFLGMIGYTVWMYADFAGGIDIVLGAAQMFGIRLPENFDRPFMARNLADFWRRWHMTLMQWLREYIFFPVSTSRFSRKLSAAASSAAGLFAGGKDSPRSKKFGMKAPVYAANLTVWLIAGLWHGASWNFVAWGLSNCIVMLVSAEFTGAYRRYRKRFAFTDSKGYRAFEMIRTFFLFCILEMFEYYPVLTVPAMFAGMITAFHPEQLFDGQLSALGLSGADWLLILAGTAVMALGGIYAGKEDFRTRLERKPVWIRYAAVFGLFLIVLLTGAYGHGYDASQFIYNQF